MRLETGREVEVTDESLEDLLACDDVFLDYFNAFLRHPAFTTALRYDRLTGTLLKISEQHETRRNSDEGEEAPMYGANEAQREAILAWVKSERLPFFLQTRFYLEYKLCRYLVRPLQPLRPRSEINSLLGGVSRQENPSSNESPGGQRGGSANDDLLQQLAGLKYLRPGSRAFSLPVGIARIREQVHSFDQREADSGRDRNPIGPHVPEKLPVNTYDDNEYMYMEEKYPDIQEVEEEDQNSVIDFGEDEENIDRVKSPVENVNSLQESKENIFDGKDSIESFKKFLRGTQGEKLISFWLDCEQFRDDMLQFQEIESREIQTKIFFHAFRGLLDKYRLQLSRPTRDQLALVSAHNFSPLIFSRVQYDALRRLRSYWAPRFVIFRQSHLPSNARQKSVVDDVANESPVDFLPSLDVSRTLPLQPNSAWSDLANPMVPWQHISSSGKGQDQRVRSGKRAMPGSGGQLEGDEIGNCIVVDKEAGGPFQRFLQQRCLHTSDVHTSVASLAQYLYWQDMIDLRECERRAADRTILLSNAWGIFNKFFNPQSLWAVTRDEVEIDQIRNDLKVRGAGNDVYGCSHIFDHISSDVLAQLKIEWTNYAVRDTETLNLWLELDSEQYRSKPASTCQEPAADLKQDIQVIKRVTGADKEEENEKRKNIRNKQPETLTEKQMRLRQALITAQDIEIEKKKAREQKAVVKRVRSVRTQKKSVHKQQHRETPIEQSRNEEKDGKKKKVRELPTLRDITLPDILKHQWMAMQEQFLEYAIEFEGLNAHRMVQMYFDINKFEKLNQPKLQQYQLDFIDKTYLDAYGPKRVNLPKKFLVKEKLNAEKLSSIKEYLEKSLSQPFLVFREGQNWKESQKRNKSEKEGREQVPDIWVKRRVENGLPSRSAQRAGVKQTPSFKDRHLLRRIMENSHGQKEASILDMFREYLRQHGQSQDAPFMASSLDFVLEVTKLGQFMHEHQDEPLLNRKIQGIVGVFLDSASEPKVRVEVSSAAASRLVKQAEMFVRVKSKRVEDISEFTAEAEALYEQLLHYWSAFWAKRALAIKSRAYHARGKSGQLLVSDTDGEQLEEVEQFHLEFSLPDSRPPATQFGSGISFSLSEGIKWKGVNFDEMYREDTQGGGSNETEVLNSTTS